MSAADSLEDLVPELPSEDALAEEFTRRHSDDFKFLAARGAWMHYCGGVWLQENTLRVFDLARQVVRDFADRDAEERQLGDSARAKTEAALKSAKTVSNVVTLARADRLHAIASDLIDRDPELLNTPGGEVHLPTGELRPHDRVHYHTKQTAATPAAGPAPVFRAFLHRVTGADEEMQAYLQRLAGYSLYGGVVEHVLPFVWGPGGNGKTVFLTMISGILGSYAVAAPMSAFVEQRGTAHPTELAMLDGARLVIASETEPGQRLATARIKMLTGGDPVTARFMHGNFFTYTPRFLLVLSGNSKMRLSAVDEGVRRRMHMIPFTATIPAQERDPHLADKLKAEWPQILHWMIDGFQMWQAEGLNPPATVTTSTDDYLDGEDTLGQWVEDATEPELLADASSTELYEDYLDWAAHFKEREVTMRRFANDLRDRGWKATRSRTSRGFTGHRLKPVADRPWAGTRRNAGATPW